MVLYYFILKASRVAYTDDSTKIFFSLKITVIGYSGESGLLGVGYTRESGSTGVGYTASPDFPV
jgi:hypothetical protein